MIGLVQLAKVACGAFADISFASAGKGDLCRGIRRPGFRRTHSRAFCRLHTAAVV
jgi:hypothetical protein